VRVTLAFLLHVTLMFTLVFALAAAFLAGAEESGKGKENEGGSETRLR